MNRLFLLCLVWPLFSFAQTGRPLSLAEAEVLWSKHSHELQLAHMAVTGALADVQTAGQVPNPQLSINMDSISPSTGLGAGGWKSKKMDTQVRLEQLIERGGKKELRVKAAEARLDAARSDSDDLARQQLLALRIAYFELLQAQEKYRLAQETAELYGRSSATGKLRYRVGDISQVDLSRLEIDKSRADNETRQAQADLEAAQISLAYLIGRQADAKYLSVDSDWPRLDAEVVPATEVVQRPAVLAARARLQAAESARDLARSMKKRDVTVGFQLERNGQGEPVNSMGLGVSVPLFLWHENEGEIGRAEAELNAARIAYDQTLAQSLGEQSQWQKSLFAAVDRLKRLETGLLADAERVARAAEFAYGKGAMALMDLLDARRTLKQIQYETVSARGDYAKALMTWRSQLDIGKMK